MSRAPKVPISTEAEIQRNCMKFLANHGIQVWRSNSRVFMVPGKGGRERPMRAGLGRGSADLIGILPDGRFLAVECKRPGEKPSLEQGDWLRSVNSHGGLAIWVDHISILESLIRNLEFCRDRAARLVIDIDITSKIRFIMREVRDSAQLESVY